MKYADTGASAGFASSNPNRINKVNIGSLKSPTVRWPRACHNSEPLDNVRVEMPRLGRHDYLLACGDVYANFMNEQTEENETRFEEFMNNKTSGRINRTIAASYNGLISKEELEAYQQGYQPEAYSNTTKFSDKDDLLPVIYMIPGMIGGVLDPIILRTLLDSGSGKTLINKSVLPAGAEVRPCENKDAMNTMAGIFQPTGYVILKDLRLPEFDKNLSIDGQMAYVFDSPCRYQVIAGRDFLRRTEINLTFKKNHITWMDWSIPMKSPHFSEASYNAIIDDYNFWMEEDELELNETYMSQMMPAKYEKADLEKFAKEQTHLSPSQQDDLLKLWKKHEKLFDGTLGKYTGEKMHIDIEPGAKPHHARPYPVTRDKAKLLKDELDRMESMGVIEPTGDSEWGSGAFGTPKKDGTIRVVADLRALNKVIRPRRYPMPIVLDLLRKRLGYKFFSKLDISMQYWTFELDEESKDLCTIVTPFGTYRHCRAPMGLQNTPGFAQAQMVKVLRGIEEQDCYIDDIGVWNNDKSVDLAWQKHIVSLDKVLTRLEDHNFTVNPLKCEWGVQETDFLGYWLTPTGIKPWSTKVEAIVNMKEPATITDLRSFIGLVGFYSDLFPQRAHILAPLTSLGNLPKGKKLGNLWTPECSEAFKKMKSIVAADCLLAYPDHNKPFYIYTDASDFQLGAVIMQRDDEGVLRPVAYFSQKLNPAQRNYTTIEKELLSMVMVLKQYRTMLYGAELHIYTDHKNLTFDNFNTQRVLRWRCYIEEYHPRLFYIEGKRNILADAFSRLPRRDNQNEAVELDCLVTDDWVGLCRSNPAVAFSHLNCDSAGNEMIDSSECFFGDAIMDNMMLALPISEKEVYECFFNVPNVPMQNNPLNMKWIAESQERDPKTKALRNNPGKYYHLKPFGDTEVLCYTRPGGDVDTQWRIVLTDETVGPAIRWFHEVGGHPGRDRLYWTMSARYHYVGLKREIEALECDVCQRFKNEGPGYGHLPPRELYLAPWYELAVDSIGPWSIEVGGTRSQANTYEFHALTCIDTVSNLVELIRTEHLDAAATCDYIDRAWMCRYPWPKRCVHDGGPEFKREFQDHMERRGVKTVQTTSHNPTANGICERMHLTVQQLIRIYTNLHPPKTLEQARQIVDKALAAASHAMRINVTRALGHNSPGALAFGRDMLLDVPFIADWEAVRENRKLLVNENLRRTNQKRRRFDYQPGQQVLVRRPGILRKLNKRFDGPFEIAKVHVNGNVTINRSPHIIERLNIKRIKPYRQPNM